MKLLIAILIAILIVCYNCTGVQSTNIYTHTTTNHTWNESAIYNNLLEIIIDSPSSEIVSCVLTMTDNNNVTTLVQSNNTYQCVFEIKDSCEDYAYDLDVYTVRSNTTITVYYFQCQTNNYIEDLSDSSGLNFQIVISITIVICTCLSASIILFIYAYCRLNMNYHKQKEENYQELTDLID